MHASYIARSQCVNRTFSVALPKFHTIKKQIQYVLKSTILTAAEDKLNLRAKMFVCVNI